ncbi:glycosyltransferase [Bacillus sp. DNRA2]|nr:glycosyltransferase [Bacillus sp. DNRA2]
MIVKNESKIIERCLNSAKGVIDCISICDTGSTDGTPEIIKNWCKDKKIPGTVHFEPFKNFGYNRSKAVTLAKEAYPKSDYLLLLDADMVLEVSPEFNKNSLKQDQYLTMQYNRKIKYWLTRLLKTSLPWHSVGVTHEYWDIDRAKLPKESFIYIDSKGKLDSLIVNDQEDGGSKTDKFERDKQLLLQGLGDSKTPGFLRGRYMFYLAQTHMCLGEYAESIHWYKKRIEVGGWVEEIYYSLLQIGLCYDFIANSTESNEESFALALHYFQKAWETRPTRAEPLYHLARLHRINSNHHLGLLFASRGKEIPFPNEDILFVDYHVYEYLFDYEISICANYIKDKLEIGRAAQKRLESMIDRLPDHLAVSVKNNARFY